MSEEKVIEKVARHRYIYLATWVSSSALNVYLFLWSSTGNEIFNTAAMYFSGCFGILSMLSFGKSVMNQANRVTGMLVSDSFSIYLFHFVWIIVFEYYFSLIVHNIPALFILSVFSALAATLISSEIVKACPILNCLFGIRAKHKIMR